MEKPGREHIFQPRPILIIKSRTKTIDNWKDFQTTILDWKSYPPSAWVLIVSNILVGIAVIASGVTPAGLVWAYWLESLIMGLFTVLTIITIAVKEKSLVLGHGRHASSIISAITIFILVYGGLHAFYAFVLSILKLVPVSSDMVGVGTASFIFLLSHGFSFIKNIIQNSTELENTNKNLRRLVEASFHRIGPIHSAIILSQIVKLHPLGFIMIKTTADLFGHIKRYRKSEKDL